MVSGAPPGVSLGGRRRPVVGRREPIFLSLTHFPAK
jgi:hypothetical protein